MRTRYIRSIRGQGYKQPKKGKAADSVQEMKDGQKMSDELNLLLIKIQMKHVREIDCMIN